VGERVGDMEEPETEVISRRKSLRPIAVARTQGIVLRRRRDARTVGVDIVFFVATVLRSRCRYCFSFFFWRYMSGGAVLW